MENTKTIGPIETNEYAKHGLSQEKLLQMLRTMIELRRFEERVERLFLQEGALIGPSHLYLGEEAVAAGAIGALNDDDLITSTYRGHGHAIAKGVPMKPLMAELFGKATGTCKGLGGSMHVAIYPEKGSVYATAIVGSGVPIATGLGLALQREGKRRVAMTFFGDGATNTGAFHEGINLACVWKVPVIFVCENNKYATATPLEMVAANPEIASRAAAFAMKGVAVNGSDVIAVYEATAEARQRAVNGEGPTLIECKTYRHGGHYLGDQLYGTYRTKEEVDTWMALKDPIKNFKIILKEVYGIDDNSIKLAEKSVEKEMEEAYEYAKASPLPDPSTVGKHLFSGGLVK